MGDSPLAQKSTRYNLRINARLPEENVLLFARRDCISCQKGCLSFASVILITGTDQSSMGDPPLAQTSTRYNLRVNEHLPEENVLYLP